MKEDLVFYKELFSCRIFFLNFKAIPDTEIILTSV
jgi:hypothetical protein